MPAATKIQTWTEEGRPRLQPHPWEKRAYGPWDGEPDKAQWVDSITDMDCLAVRNHFGAWCGYVATTEDHPWFGIDYAQCLQDCGDPGCWGHGIQSEVSVHGGITYNDFCMEDGGEFDICHVPLDGRPDRVWWFGFDCGHAWDLQPGLSIDFGAIFGSPSVYRTLDYVMDQCSALAVQLKAAADRH